MESYIIEKHPSEYLYGMKSLDGILHMPYFKAIAYKMVLAILTKTSLVKDTAIEVDSYRIIAINKAISFNRGLLEEIGMSKTDIEGLVKQTLSDIKEYSLDVIMESHKGD